MIPTNRCVIYVRVSSERQVREGNGLSSQEQRCRAYAEAKGYQVMAVFRDEGLTGALLERQGMRELLAFLKSHRSGGEIVVIFDDLSRFARHVLTHIQLHATIRSCGGRLESPSFRFEDTPMGEMVEIIFAAVAQYGRTGNREQVMNRQRARLEAGFWTFHPPAGYVYAKDPTHKKIVVPDGRRSEIVREALENYALHRFATKTEIYEFYMEKGYYRTVTNRHAGGHKTAAQRLLENRWFYAGYVEYAPWGISRREGRHEAIISEETARRIDRRLGERPESLRVRSYIDVDLALRNYVRCAGCGRPLSGGYAKRKYPGYHCYNAGNCPRYGHRIKSRELHERLESLLMSLAATEEQVRVMHEVSRELWEEKVADWRSGDGEAHRRLHTLDEQISALARRISQATEETLIRAYEREMTRFGDERTQVESGILPPDEIPDYDAAFESVSTLLRDPCAMWKNGSANQKKAVCRLVFATPPAYDRETGFCTADYSVPYRISRCLAAPESRLVELTRDTWLRCIDAITEMSRQLEGLRLAGDLDPNHVRA